MHSPEAIAPPRAAQPSPLEPRPEVGRGLYIQGLLALRDGDADGAVRLLLAALRWQPSHQGMHRNLVRALIAAGQFPKPWRKPMPVWPLPPTNPSFILPEERR